MENYKKDFSFFKMNTVIIIGSGPAAYTAGLYLGRADLSPLILEGDNPGGQLLTTTDVENFPGFDSINGFDLVSNIKNQCLKYGAKTLEENVISLKKLEEGHFELVTPKNIYLSKSVIIATGATAKIMQFEGSQKYWGHGISACAVCDGALPMFRNKNIVVIGGGDSVMEEALFLTKFANKVFILHRSEKFKASSIMLKRAKNNEKIEFICGEIISAQGDTNLKQIIYRSNKTNENIVLETNGLFYAIGHTPNTSFLSSEFKLKSSGYLKVKKSKTNVKGAFGCGDVADNRYKQAITAAGSGCSAALDCIKYLEELS